MGVEDGSAARPNASSALRDRVVGALSTLVQGFGEAPAGVEKQRILLGLVTAILRVLVLAFAQARGIERTEGEGSLTWVREAPPGQTWARLLAAFGTREGGLFTAGAFPFLERSIDDE